MLRRAKGATVDEIAEALEWQSHTVRGAIAGALKKKLGLEVTSEKDDKRGRGVPNHRLTNSGTKARRAAFAARWACLIIALFCIGSTCYVDAEGNYIEVSYNRRIQV